MAKRNTTYYLIKIARISGWLLFFLMLVFIVTGFAALREFGLDRLIGYREAVSFHRFFEWPLVIVFVTHSSITIYFALRRWGWIKKRTKT